MKTESERLRRHSYLQAGPRGSRRGREATGGTGLGSLRRESPSSQGPASVRGQASGCWRVCWDHLRSCNWDSQAPGITAGLGPSRLPGQKTFSVKSGCFYMHAHVCTLTHTCTHLYACTCTHARAWTCRQLSLHARTSVVTHTSVHTRRHSRCEHTRARTIASHILLADVHRVFCCSSGGDLSRSSWALSRHQEWAQGTRASLSAWAGPQSRSVWGHTPLQLSPQNPREPLCPHRMADLGGAHQVHRALPTS